MNRMKIRESNPIDGITKCDTNHKWRSLIVMSKRNVKLS